MAMKDRATLENYFKSGSMPTQAHFEHLIESTVNKIDDGFSKTQENGLMLATVGDAEKVISLYENIEDDQAQWSILLDKYHKEEHNKDGMHFVVPTSGQTVLSLDQEGKVGVNETNPQSTLHVNGWSASKGRMGCYATSSEVPANGEWHPIVEGLDHCQGFELVARTGIKDTGKHALLHAVAMSSFGKSFSRIRRTHSRYSFWIPCRLQVRWRGDVHDYRLELRCKQDLGPGVMIKYYLTQLWSDEEMGIPVQYSPREELTK